MARKQRLPAVWLAILLPAATALSSAGGMNYQFLVFESQDAVREIYQSEQAAVGDVAKILGKLKEARDKLRIYLGHVPDLRDDEERRDFYSNSVNVYQGLKNMGVNGKYAMESLGEASDLITEAREPFSNGTSNFATHREMEAAEAAMLTLFDTYQLDWSKAASTGDVVGTQSRLRSVDFSSEERLKIEDLGVLATKAAQETLYDQSIDMFLAAETVGGRSALDDAARNGSFGQNGLEILAKSRKAVVDLNNRHLMKRPHYAGHLYQIKDHFVGEDMRPLKMTKKRRAKVAQKEKPYADLKTIQGKEAVFKHSCRGHGLLYTKTTAFHTGGRTKCQLLHHGNPYLKLGPFKLEVASILPYIVVFHHILTEKEIDFMVEYSKPRLSRERILDAENDIKPYESRGMGGKQKRKIVAKTVQTWIEDVIHEDKLYFDEYFADEWVTDKTDYTGNFVVVNEVLYRLSKKISLATFMNITGQWSSTNYQITNYGLGGMCENHIDPHGYIEGADLPIERNSLKLSGDYIATFMGWLNAAEYGGGTAFTMADVTVYPEKGSAAFWFSLDKKSHRDVRTEHVGCPVLKGSKWILNKWIYSFDQFRSYPCSLDPKELIPPFAGVYGNEAA